MRTVATRPSMLRVSTRIVTSWESTCRKLFRKSASSVGVRRGRMERYSAMSFVSIACSYERRTPRMVASSSVGAMEGFAGVSGFSGTGVGTDGVAPARFSAAEVVIAGDGAWLGCGALSRAVLVLLAGGSAVALGIVAAGTVAFVGGDGVDCSGIVAP